MSALSIIYFRMEISLISHFLMLIKLQIIISQILAEN